MGTCFDWSPAYGQELIEFYRAAIRKRSYSDEEGEVARLVKAKMEALGFDEAYIDPTGNVVGRVGSGAKIIHFDSHMDTVQVNEPEDWTATGCAWSTFTVTVA